MNAELVIQLFHPDSIVGATFRLKNCWHQELVVTIDRLHPDPEEPDIIAEATACTKHREVIEIDPDDDLTRVIWSPLKKQFLP